MNNHNIRVGIIGAGGWAKYRHIPALQNLQEFEIVAVSSHKQETADQTAAHFNIPHPFGDEQALVNHPEADLVAVVAPAPEHARLVKAVIEAGKDVYSEWPLTTSTAVSEELLSLAEAKRVRHMVGLQRRMGPSARYTRDLLKTGLRGQTPQCSHDSEYRCLCPNDVRKAQLGLRRRKLLERPLDLRRPIR